MKIKQATRFQLHEYTRPAIVYYMIMLGIFLVTLLLRAFIPGAYNTGNSSVETTTMIFLFVLGLNSFKTPFRIYQQNGVSRMTQVVGFILAALCLSLAMNIVDSLMPLLFGGSLRYRTTYSLVYETFRTVSHGGLSVMSFCWSFLVYFLMMCLGFFITTLYYRMNKLLKVVVSAGVPLLLFFVLPMLEIFVPSFRLFTWLMETVMWCVGLDNYGLTAVPMRAMGMFAALSAVLLGLSTLLARGATLKER